MSSQSRYLAAVMRQQWAALCRDQRLKLLGLALLLVSVTALVTNAARQHNLVVEREAAVHADRDIWSQQGAVNPHGAAHFGHYAVKPVPILSTFDPGLFEALGTMLRLEAHKQNVAGDRPRDAGTALTSFCTFSVASALQMLAPLLILLTGFTVFSGVHARSLLTQEIAAGVSPIVLMTGRLLTLGAAVLSVVVVFAVAGAGTLYMSGATGMEYVRLAWMLAGYALYLVTFVALSLGVSALCASTRSSLTALLGVWLCAVMLMPRIAPAVAAHVFPTPPVPTFQREVQDAIDAGFDGDESRDTRSARLKAMVLQKYGVTRVEDLPVNSTGVTLEYSEELSTRVFREHFAQLYSIYQRQAEARRIFAVASPLIALQPWSAAFADTDFAAHQRFLSQAEQYRYEFVQALNRDILHNRPRTNEAYVADVGKVTAGVDHFEPSVEEVGSVFSRQWPDLAVLLAWAVASVVFALACARRLRSGG